MYYGIKGNTKVKIDEKGICLTNKITKSRYELQWENVSAVYQVRTSHGNTWFLFAKELCSDEYIFSFMGKFLRKLVFKRNIVSCEDLYIEGFDRIEKIVKAIPPEIKIYKKGREW